MLKQHRKNLTKWQFNWAKRVSIRGMASVPSPSCSLFCMYIGWELAGHFAAVAEAEAKPAKQ